MADAQAAPGGLEALRIDRAAPPLRRRRLRRWLIPALLVLFAVVAVAGGLSRRPPTVRVAEVREARPGEQQTELSAAGYVGSRRRSVVAPLIAGRLDAVLVEEGDSVREGQVIARLDNRDARAALERARAEVASAEGSLAEARARNENAQIVLARTRRLARLGVVPRSQLDDALAGGRASAAEQDAALARLSAARHAREAAALQLQHTIIRAPFDGTVAKKIADVGAVLAPAALGEANLGGIVELVDLGALEVEAEVSEEQLSRIRPGQPALIFLDAFPDKALSARTGLVRPSIDRSKATAQVKVLFEQVPPGVLPDMGAKVSFLKEALPPEALREGSHQLRVPASAVVRGAQGPVVWVVADGRVRQERVETGPQVGEEVSLTRGPAPGTQVVVSPTGKLREGRAVKVSTEGA
ncbi:efflux RND transporter periplasmic adaptor subunit [Myxococcaceae bacterium GXIMD 01537]